MSIFELHRRVLEDYQDFIRAFVIARDPRIQAEIHRLLQDEQHLWPEPLVQLSPAYRREATIDQLAAEGLLHPITTQIFRRSGGQPIHLYTHQVQAIRALQQGRSVVVTSGTGSGKSYCYFIPIVDLVARHPDEPGPIALVVYPMNALVNSQYHHLEELQKRYQERTGRPFPLRFARYTGETPNEEREAIRRDPPHLLLTNYVMAELLLDRPEDAPLVAPRPDARVPFFLVFDELHTYRGRQGADVALLVRRLRARLDRPAVVHVGTSATLVAHREATAAERRQVVADFASRFFGHPIAPEDIVEETLEPVTVGPLPSPDELVQAIARPLPEDPDALRAHPLARWLEHALGVQPEPDGTFRRRTPRPLSAVARDLAAETGLAPETCRARLQEILELGSRRRDATGQPLFALKLHQFISQSHALYATLEPANQRRFATEPRASGEHLRLPLAFCRVCGQEYYRVLVRGDRLEPYPPGSPLDDADAVAGYLVLAEAVPDWSEERFPDDWRDAHGRLRDSWRNRIPRPLWVFPDGRLAEGEAEAALPAWLETERFWLCLQCGTWYGVREGEYQRLTYLASEGRSSATTVLAVSLLRHARALGGRDKLLTFTDSRQDASLQAGHFNDFVHVAVLRSALYAALRERSPLAAEEVAEAVVRHMGLTLDDIAVQRGLREHSPAALVTRDCFRDLTAYRLYEDLRRGWRVALPNLEDVGLLRIDYLGLPELAADEDAWRDVPVFSALDPARRERILRAVLDHFRRELAVDAPLLADEDLQRRLRERAQSNLNDFWGLDSSTSSLRRATTFVWPAPSEGDEDVRSLAQGTQLGRFLTRRLHLDPETYAADPGAARAAGQLRARHAPDAQRRDAHRAPAAHRPSLDARQRHPGRRPGPRTGAAQRGRTPSQRLLPALLPGGSPRTGRAGGTRAYRPGGRVRRAGPPRAPLPLDGGRPARPHARPPTPLPRLLTDDGTGHRHRRPRPRPPAQRPAYASQLCPAQRRAGRQGQPGLILTFCGALHGHDQYFFRHREEMVAGAVRAPRLDLANETLLRTHILAEWLSETGVALRDSVESVLDIERDPDYPLQDTVREQLQLNPAQRQRLQRRFERILTPLDQQELARTGWFSDRWLEQLLDSAPERFDRAFDRWRELFRAATEQLEKAQKLLRTARDRTTQDEARRQQDEALRQRNLLLQNDVAREESDFYPYRYLATEEFLPGYNFPSLPVRAWVPRGEGEFIARPRHLAVTEFAPGNTVYHEGAKWQFARFISPIGAGSLEQRWSPASSAATAPPGTS
jgi:hypothetical protein